MHREEKEYVLIHNWSFNRTYLNIPKMKSDSAMKEFSATFIKQFKSLKKNDAFLLLLFSPSNLLVVGVCVFHILRYVASSAESSRF